MGETTRKAVLAVWEIKIQVSGMYYDKAKATLEDYHVIIGYSRIRFRPPDSEADHVAFESKSCLISVI